MSDAFVPFDDMRRCVAEAFADAEAPDVDIYLVRNLFGKLRISVSDTVENEAHCAALQRFAGKLAEALGARGYPADNGVLFVSDSLLDEVRETAESFEGFDNVRWEERMVAGRGWWTAPARHDARRAKRWTLFSVKGGVGRSTTAAVLARHLARGGERVLVIDLDLESPALSSAMLEPGARPDFGVADWFVEDLVGQGDRVIERVTAAPAWADDVNGAAVIAPAHGRDAGEYLAKLGRVHMESAKAPWAARLERLLTALEARHHPTVVLLDSRCGLHDIAAAAVTDIAARVLLFADGSEAGWADYGLLFRHWRERGRTASICERLSFVSALTPPKNGAAYLDRFRERTLELFRDHLYEAPDSSPMPVFWHEDLAAGASLRDPGETAVETAYRGFFNRFASLAGACEEGAAHPPAPGALPKNA